MDNPRRLSKVTRPKESPQIETQTTRAARFKSPCSLSVRDPRSNQEKEEKKRRRSYEGKNVVKDDLTHPRRQQKRRHVQHY
jgi:hypothetical protein